MLGSEDERPSFLRRTGSVPTSATTIMTTSSIPGGGGNTMMRSSSFASLTTASKQSHLDVKDHHGNTGEEDTDDFNTASSSTEKIVPTSPASQLPSQLPQTLSATFNNNTNTNSMLSLSTSTTADHDYVEANVFLRRYFLMIKMIFLGNQQNHLARHLRDLGTDSNYDWEGLAALYKDAVNVYRSITVTRGGIEMEWESW
jgi:hypothetical protein